MKQLRSARNPLCVRSRAFGACSLSSNSRGDIGHRQRYAKRLMNAEEVTRNDPGTCMVAAFELYSDPMQSRASIWPDSQAHSTRGPSNQSPHTPSLRSGFHKAPSPVPAESA